MTSETDPDGNTSTFQFDADNLHAKSPKEAPPSGRQE
jgi:hypothetical protein